MLNGLRCVCYVCASKWALVTLVVFPRAKPLPGSPVVMEILDHWQWEWTASISAVCVSVCEWVCAGVLWGYVCLYWSHWSILQQQNVTWNIYLYFLFLPLHWKPCLWTAQKRQISLLCLFLTLECCWWGSLGYAWVKRLDSHSLWLRLLKRQADNRLVFWVIKAQKSQWEPLPQKASPFLWCLWYLKLRGSAWTSFNLLWMKTFPQYI